MLLDITKITWLSKRHAIYTSTSGLQSDFNSITSDGVILLLATGTPESLLSNWPLDLIEERVADLVLFNILTAVSRIVISPIFSVHDLRSCLRSGEMSLFVLLEWDLRFCSRDLDLEPVGANGYWFRLWWIKVGTGECAGVFLLRQRVSFWSKGHLLETKHYKAWKDIIN